MHNTLNRYAIFWRYFNKCNKNVGTSLNLTHSTVYPTRTLNATGPLGRADRRRNLQRQKQSKTWKIVNGMMSSSFQFIRQEQIK